MQAYNVEYTTEQYKILKDIYSAKQMTAERCRKKYGTKMFQRSFKVLRDSALIVLIREPEPAHYEITVKGTNTYFILREARLEFWKKLLLSKWIDVLVAFITAGITADHWHSIKAFFDSVLTAFFK